MRIRHFSPEKTIIGLNIRPSVNDYTRHSEIREVTSSNNWARRLLRMKRDCQVVARFVHQYHHKIQQFGKKFRYFSGFLKLCDKIS
jgi:hypothetical protein